MSPGQAQAAEHIARGADDTRRYRGRRSWRFRLRQRNHSYKISHHDLLHSRKIRAAILHGFQTFHFRIARFKPEISSYPERILSGEFRPNGRTIGNDRKTSAAQEDRPLQVQVSLGNAESDRLDLKQDCSRCRNVLPSVAMAHSHRHITRSATAPILCSGGHTFSPLADTLTESGIQPKAMRFYGRAVQELHRGHAVAAEKDAIRRSSDR